MPGVHEVQTLQEPILVSTNPGPQAAGQKFGLYRAMLCLLTKAAWLDLLEFNSLLAPVFALDRRLADETPDVEGK